MSFSDTEDCTQVLHTPAGSRATDNLEEFIGLLVSRLVCRRSYSDLYVPLEKRYVYLLRFEFRILLVVFTK